MVERIDPRRIHGLGPDFDAEKFADQDLLIRSGRCPNKCGLLTPTDFGQQCEKCGFFCNMLAEKETVQ